VLDWICFCCDNDHALHVRGGIVDEILSQSTAEFVMCTKFHVSKVM